MWREGSAFLRTEFPGLDYIMSCARTEELVGSPEAVPPPAVTPPVVERPVVLPSVPPPAPPPVVPSVAPVAPGEIDESAPDPDAVDVRCFTTEGYFTVRVNPSWAPLGAARFLEMVDDEFFSDRVPGYRTVAGFLMQFGIPPTPDAIEKWQVSAFC
jgi:hypothetical protein